MVLCFYVFFSCAFMFVIRLCVERYVFSFVLKIQRKLLHLCTPRRIFCAYLCSYCRKISSFQPSKLQRKCSQKKFPSKWQEPRTREKYIKFNLIKAWSAAMKPWSREFRKFRKKWKLPELFRLCRGSSENAELLGVCDEMKNHPPLNQIGKSCLPSSCWHSRFILICAEAKDTFRYIWSFMKPHSFRFGG